MIKNFINDTWEEFNARVKTRKLILFGVCDMGMKIIRDCKKYQSAWEVKCFIDNNTKKWETTFEGLPVYSPDYLKELDSDQYVVLITSMHITEMAEQLEALGTKFYYSSFWIDQENRDFYVQKEMNEEQLESIRELLVDQRSKDILDKVRYKRKNGLLDYSDVYSATEYFIDEFFSHTSEEVFVDGGGYTGDTIEEFDRWTKGEFKRIYSYEPDKNKAAQLKEILYRFGDKVRFFEKGLYSAEGELNFKENQDFYSSRITMDDADASYCIPCCSIDETVEEKVTFIKMDIEGAELQALEGAKKIILRDKPKLAICIYHNPNDLWEIPIWIHNLVPEYKFYIRHHGQRCYGTILYAVL